MNKVVEEIVKTNTEQGEQRGVFSIEGTAEQEGKHVMVDIKGSNVPSAEKEATQPYID